MRQAAKAADARATSGACVHDILAALHDKGQPAKRPEQYQENDENDPRQAADLEGGRCLDERGALGALHIKGNLWDLEQVPEQ